MTKVGDSFLRFNILYADSRSIPLSHFAIGSPWIISGMVYPELCTYGLPISYSYGSSTPKSPRKKSCAGFKIAMWVYN